MAKKFFMVFALVSGCRGLCAADGSNGKKLLKKIIGVFLVHANHCDVVEMPLPVGAATRSVNKELLDLIEDKMVPSDSTSKRDFGDFYMERGNKFLNLSGAKFEQVRGQALKYAKDAFAEAAKHYLDAFDEKQYACHRSELFRNAQEAMYKAGMYDSWDFEHRCGGNIENYTVPEYRKTLCSRIRKCSKLLEKKNI